MLINMKIIITLLVLMSNIYVKAQLVKSNVMPDQIEKIYRSKYGAFIKIVNYTDEFGGSSGLILNKGADYKKVKLSENLSQLIIEKILDKVNELRSNEGLVELIRNAKLDDDANIETNNRLKAAIKYHHTFPPNEFELPNDSFPNGISGIGNYPFQCGNNSCVIEVDRKTLKSLSKSLKKWEPTDVSEICNRIVEEFWLSSKDHRQNLLNSYISTGLAITAANYRFKDYYFDEAGDINFFKPNEIPPDIVIMTGELDKFNNLNKCGITSGFALRGAESGTTSASGGIREIGRAHV